jgi:hypothetical protein
MSLREQAEFMQSMFSFSHLCKVLPGKYISIVLDSGIVVKGQHWLLGRGYFIWGAVQFFALKTWSFLQYLHEKSPLFLPQVR